MKSRHILPTIVGILILGIGFLFIFNKVANRDRGLVGSRFVQQITSQQPSSSPIPIPTPSTPKTFQFDASTDLKVELEKITPQVLDTDFE